MPVSLILKSNSVESLLGLIFRVIEPSAVNFKELPTKALKKNEKILIRLNKTYFNLLSSV